MSALCRTPAMLLTLIVAAGAAATPADAAVAPLWDHPGYDAEDSHHNPRETVINAGSIRSVTQKWQVSLRTSDQSCSGNSTPVLSGGRIIVSDQLGISAYAAATGTFSWRYDWDDPGDSGTPRLAVSGGLVIVAGGDCNSQSDPDGRLIALDAGTGLPRWRQRLGSPVDSVVVDKNVIVISGGSPSDEDVVAAFAVRDGRALWSKDRFLSSEVSADGTLLVRATDGSGAPAGSSAGISIETGAVRWTREGVSWAAQAADPAGERFYVTDRAGLLSAVRVADGTPGWTAAGTENSLVAVDTTRIYRVNGTNVDALSVLDGKRLWTARQGVDGVQPVQAGGLLYAGGAVLDPADGEVAGPDRPGQVIVAGGRIHQVRDAVLRSFGP
ncbi:PQQ-binding-like beta-propeller repeat protein [Actinoplanes sp. NEAU-A12]|uniref:PQQ-binding-like beta-propeller repeat protein n=1 Tax=Actinoplanes sandaracinus TaxID=3045177 RepID=A0ABT6WTN3_9ACTN|nr:PQQ-binding-like beta-propeller repeat protein [Actinoplanes sandaracinus]MDI6103106.1 PQQ-binding-like beta-propeller repeat protein [Actinoplanes sandaracinus]